jgi:hypothetical protein
MGVWLFNQFVLLVCAFAVDWSLQKNLILILTIFLIKIQKPNESGKFWETNRLI